MKPESESRPLPNLALGAKRAAHGHRESPANGEPEAGTVCHGPLWLELHEWLEDRVELVGRNPLAGIDHPDSNRFRLDPALERDAPSAIGELDRIREQIEQNLLHL